MEHRELSLVVRDDLEGWGGSGREEGSREGIYVSLSSPVVQQKSIQHCYPPIKN